MMKRQKPATGGASAADMERGYSDQDEQNDPDAPQYDRLEGYSEPLEGGKRGGFLKRNNYHERH